MAGERRPSSATSAILIIASDLDFLYDLDTVIDRDPQKQPSAIFVHR
ncbi:MAG: hypothetical protein J0H65_09690 [Rhizobiales bacterium]|nr:hypothetical protein [Hyphomicrobiales bacterium]